MMTSYIISSGHYCEAVTDDLPVLKLLVKQSTGEAVRRVGRFIQLALIGAGRTAQSLPPGAGLYLSSGRGDIEITTQVLNTIYQERQSPRPLDFINTVSNAACFYVAKILKLTGPSSFISHRYFSFEVALRSALLDLQFGVIPSALVGAVDLVTSPLDDHRERLQLSAKEKVAEASHWLQLVNEPGEHNVLAVIEQHQHFSSQQQLIAWLDQQTDLPEHLALGQYTDQNACLSINALQHCSLIEDKNLPGHFDSRAGRIFCQFVDGDLPSLMYMNSDRHDRHVVFVLRREL